MVAVGVDLWVGRVVGTAVGVAAVAHPAILEVVEGVSSQVEAEVVVAGTGRTVVVLRQTMEAVAVEIDPAAVLQHPSEAAVPSSVEFLVAPEMTALASVAAGVAFPVAEEDALPLTSEAAEVEECSLVENRLTVAEGPVEAVGVPSVVLAWTAVAAVEQPSHDASRDVGDDASAGANPRSALEVVPMEERRRRVDEACRLGSEDFVLPKVFPRHFRAVHPSRHA